MRGTPLPQHSPKDSDDMAIRFCGDAQGATSSIRVADFDAASPSDSCVETECPRKRRTISRRTPGSCSAVRDRRSSSRNGHGDRRGRSPRRATADRPGHVRSAMPSTPPTIRLGRRRRTSRPNIEPPRRYDEQGQNVEPLRAVESFHSRPGPTAPSTSSPTSRERHSSPSTRGSPSMPSVA